MQLWIAHNPARAVFVPPEGKMILWDFHNCEHLSAHLPLIGELRGGASFFYFETGDQTAARRPRILPSRSSISWQSMLVPINGWPSTGSNMLAMPRYAILVSPFLKGQVLTEHARSIKNDNELNAMRCAIHACESFH